MRLGVVGPALVRRQRGGPHRLAVHTHDEPEHGFIVDKPDVDAHIALDAALLGQDVAVLEVRQKDVTQGAKGGRLLDGQDRAPEQGPVRLTT